MATLKLTKTTVEAIEHGPRDAYAWDTALPRFGLRVTRAGSRIYLIQYRARTERGAAAKIRRVVIGQHGKPWTVDQARDEAKRLLAAVDLGRDPFAERETGLAAEAAARAALADAEAAAIRAAELRQRDSFEAVAERYFDLCMGQNRSGQETARLIRHDAFSAWEARHIAAIRRVDVADLIDGIKMRSPAVARSTYAALRGLFGWCVERDLIQSSPCDHLTAPPRPKARDRVLSAEELRAIWDGCEALGYPFGPLFKLMILTGQRRAEVAGMAWEEVSHNAATWRIPKERSKNGKAHEIDLGPQALAIIAGLDRTGPLLFPARRAPARKNARTPAEAAAPMWVRGFSATKRRLDEIITKARREADQEAKPLPAWRLHDLRRTAATNMAEMNFAPHIVERVLNHISGTQSGLVGVYQRHEYRSERKAALTVWGARVEAIVTGRSEPSNVRALRA
jgi:integrase